MWRDLELVVARADGQGTTYVTRHEPHGDAAIQRATAEALEARKFITITRDRAWPTAGGRAALDTHRRMEARRDHHR